MSDRNITLSAKVCRLDHGGPGNSATVYGHYGPEGRTCLRIGTSNTWVYELARTRPSSTDLGLDPSFGWEVGADPIPVDGDE